MIRPLIVLFVAFGLMAQDELPERTFRTTVSEVVVPVTVTNKSGAFVSGLKAQDFRLYDNEKLQEPDVDLTYSPVSMVVAIQKNAAVEGMLPSIKKIGNMLEANVIGEHGEAMLLAFDHRMRIMQDWTNDGDQFTEALDRLMVGSSTSAMIDAVFFGVRELRKRPTDHRRILLMITETRDKGSQGKLRDALIEAEMHNVIIYTVNINRGVAMLTARPTHRQNSPYPVASNPLPGGGGITPVTPHMNEQLRGQQSMTFVPVVKEIFIQTKSIFVPNKAEVFTRYTGGREFSFTNLKSLERALINVGEELHSQYILTYQPNNPEDAGYHEIGVDVNRPGLRVRAREGYWSAAKYTEGSEN
jgi:VWFA-related protein